jgi:hypothetical protein
MKKEFWYLPMIFVLVSCSSQIVEKSATSQLEVKNTCNYLLTALTEDQIILNKQDQSRAESNARIAKDDPAFAEALMDYPSLSYGILYGNNWNEHALRMISMYGKASKMVTEDTLFSDTLNDSGMVWAKRLVLHQTPPSTLKGKLDEEQIPLDTREGNVNRPMIRDTCGIPNTMLP